MERSAPFSYLLFEYERQLASVAALRGSEEWGREATIEVHSVTERTGVMYERLRYALDYKDDHLIRRHALRRILKRHFDADMDLQKAGKHLVRELISGGYLPNRTVPESAAGYVSSVLSKYLALLFYAPKAARVWKRAEDAMLDLAACELDRFFTPFPEGEAAAESLYHERQGSMLIDEEPAGKEIPFDIQLYIGVRESLLREDAMALRYALFTKFATGFERSEDLDVPKGQALIRLLDSIDTMLADALHGRIAGRLHNDCIFYSIIIDLLRRYGLDVERVFRDQALLAAEVETLAKQHYALEYARAKQGGARAVVYLLCTKIILTGVIEFPFEQLVYGKPQYLPLATNALFHPLLLLGITQTFKQPGARNTKEIVRGVAAALFDEEPVPLRLKSTEGSTPLFIGALYLALFLFSIGLIISGLRLLQFDIVGILLFLSFLTLVAYFGFRLNVIATRWYVFSGTEGRGGALRALFVLPLVRIGRALSLRFSRLNLFVLILDTLVETPFKKVLGTIDAFFNFLKEKEDEARVS